MPWARDTPFSLKTIGIRYTTLCTVRIAGKRKVNVRLCLVVGLVISGAVIRSAGLIHYDLWLDEIWTLINVSKLQSWREVFTGFHHDNNHLLNSLWVYFLGPDENPVLYRSLSLAASLATIFLAAQFSIPFAILVCCSYPLILYGTEARGYSTLILCVVGSISAIQSPESLRRHLSLLGWSVLGLLSHASFVLCIPGLLAFGLIDARAAESLFIRLGRQLMWLIPFVLFAGGLYLLHFQYLEIGGGPRGSLMEVLFNAVATSFGQHELSSYALEQSGTAFIVATLVAVVVAVQAMRMIRADNPLGLSILFTGLLVPIFVVWLVQPGFLLPRYFIVPIVFMYVGAATFVSALWARGTVARIAASALFLFFIYGNMRNVLELFRLGRGSPVEGLGCALKLTSGNGNEVTGNSDFRTTMVLDFYSRKLGQLAQLHYQPGQNPSVPVAIVEELDRLRPPEQDFNGRVLARVYPAAQLSGLPWRIYKRADVTGTCD